MKQKTLALLLTSMVLLFTSNLLAQQFSTAGFFALSNSPRQVENMNPAWRLCKDKNGTLKNEAWKVEYNDQQWGVVSLPNGLEYLPEEASGGINYRGEAWYRKHFVVDNSHKGKRLLLYFEGIMGKSKIWVNGKLVASHFGGFLPIPIDITNAIKIEQENVIAVWADNSDDANYPPGKPQAVLDFAYFGGIYRDCWLISTEKLYITDANQTNKVADGGLFIFYPEVSDKSAKVGIKLNVQNDNLKIAEGIISYELTDQQGIRITNSKEKYLLDKNSNSTFTTSLQVNNPMLWSPDFPHLYHLNIRILDKKGNLIDGYTKKIGIRSIAFNTQQGFVLNGKPFGRKLIGANRHQDYAVVGNALSNSLHWRDAYKLKQAGMDIIRNAHYPQDPAFMDACEALGLLMIENTPGWQFWSDTPIFKQRIYQDIRNIIRRDRNSPSVIMWEPVLNETHYPDDFAKTTHHIVKEEYPYSGNYTVCDNISKGHEYFDIVYTHPLNIFLEREAKEHKSDTSKVRFTREWGDNVDDWNSHNSTSRASRQWGEIPMLIQAIHYANPPYNFTSYDKLYRTPVLHIGGTLWHSFDHQRGYHPDPFYGGMMDAFRRPKYAYYMFQSQSDQVAPMVFIANEMTPFSPEDITVMSNCDEVRLYTKVGDSMRIYKHKPNNKFNEGMPYPIITFNKAWNVMKDKYFARNNMHDSSYIKAEGLRNGKVVATDIKYPSRRPAALRLIIDTATITPMANGSDLVLVVAQIVDDKGVVKRLNNGIVKFEIEGEGMLVGNAQIMANPKPIVWGEAPILVQTTTRAGRIKVKASMLVEGDHTPASTSIEFESLPTDMQMIYSEKDNLLSGKSAVMHMNTQEISDTYRQQVIQSVKEVEQQQEDFGEKHK